MLGTDAFATWSRTWVAEALIRVGDLDAARQELDEIDRKLALGDERLAELRRAYVEGVFCRAQGDVAGAAGRFRDVIASAQAARARGAELEAEAALQALTADAG